MLPLRDDPRRIISINPPKFGSPRRSIERNDGKDRIGLVETACESSDAWSRCCLFPNGTKRIRTLDGHCSAIVRAPSSMNLEILLSVDRNAPRIYRRFIYSSVGFVL